MGKISIFQAYYGLYLYYFITMIIPLLYLGSFLIFPRIMIYPFVILYIFQITQGRNKNYRNFYLKYMNPRYYFKSWTIKYEDQFNNSKCLVISQPHNISSVCQVGNYMTEKRFENFRLIGSKVAMFAPLFGLIIRWMGISSEQKKDFHNYMKKGENLMLVPGGFEEASITEYGKLNLLTHKRKGFIKFALQYGYTVYPMIHLGEEFSYKTINRFYRLKKLLNKFKIPGVFPLHLFPKADIDLLTVVGRGIEFPKIDTPNNQIIDHYHQLYLKKMLEVFERYKKESNNTSQIDFVSL